MKNDAAAEVGWWAEGGTSWPNGTGLLCLDGVRDTVDTEVSEDRSLCSA